MVFISPQLFVGGVFIRGTKGSGVKVIVCWV